MEDGLESNKVQSRRQVGGVRELRYNLSSEAEVGSQIGKVQIRVVYQPWLVTHLMHLRRREQG